MSTLFVDTINEKTTNNGIIIPGHPIQIVREYENHSSPVDTTSTSFTASGFTAAITPLKSNSLILVDFSASMGDALSANVQVKMYYKVGTGSYGVFESGNNYQIGYQNNGNRYSPFVFGGKITATSTDTLTFQPYFRSGTGGTTRIFHGSSSSCLTLTEVAQ